MSRQDLKANLPFLASGPLLAGKLELARQQARVVTGQILRERLAAVVQAVHQLQLDLEEFLRE